MPRTSLIASGLLTASVLFAAPVFAANDPTLDQVYLAANAGRFGDAQAMMDQVLRDHPNSGKAHYVEADLLAKQGQYARAQAELNTAERLAPGLPSVQRQAVQELQAVINNGHARQGGARRPSSGSDFPWGLLIVGGGLLMFIILATRFMNARNSQVVYSGGAGGAYGPGPGMQGGYGPGMGGPMMGGGGGIGSGIMGGLATGAALGAGMVAGEALMHHFTDGNGNNVPYQPQRDDPPPPDDMGGNDFGVNDPGSWDDGGSGGGGGDDWS